MLFAVLDEIREKFHYAENYGGYLQEPYTAEEKKIGDEFVEQMKQAAKEVIIIEE